MNALWRRNHDFGNGLNIMVVPDSLMFVPGRGEYEVFTALSDLSQQNETEQILREEFIAYLIHGGFLTAINDMALHGRILDRVLG